MRKYISCALGAIVAFAVVTLQSSIARADWNTGDPAKYVQHPDLATGMDVLATTPKVLADDFLCTSKDAISDIHLWGSWLNDVLPQGTTGGPDAGAVTFKLSIHDDVRLAGVPSHPGALRYSTVVRPSSVRFVTQSNELFYDPNINQTTGVDTGVYQYNFVNLPNPFTQEGTAAAPKIYWLDVQALPDTTSAKFGWKTSLEGFTVPFTTSKDDDAVFNDVPFPNDPTGSWVDMHYPSNSPLAGQSINQAFVITPEPILGLPILGVLLIGRRRCQGRHNR